MRENEGMSEESSYTSFTYPDAYDVEITVYCWLPDPEETPDPVAAVQIAHGIGEHALRYDAFARYLAKSGFAVYADDHRGHGETGRRQHGGDLSQLGRLGPGGLRATEAAIAQLTGIIRERHPGLKVAQFGHSWGSFMTQRILGDHPRNWDAVVLSGSAYRTLKFMESGPLNARWAGEPGATGFEWLSRDPEVARAFVADPLCFEANILKLFGLVDGLRLFGTPKGRWDASVPLLIMSGTDDSVSRFGKLQPLADAYRALGASDVSLKLYPEGRHEMLNETNRDEVFTDVATWLIERVGS